MLLERSVAEWKQHIVSAADEWYPPVRLFFEVGYSIPIQTWGCCLIALGSVSFVDTDPRKSKNAYMHKIALDHFCGFFPLFRYARACADEAVDGGCATYCKIGQRCGFCPFSLYL